jgi:Flp pilus assembly protein TadB
MSRSTERDRQTAVAELQQSRQSAEARSETISSRRAVAQHELTEAEKQTRSLETHARRCHAELQERLSRNPNLFVCLLAVQRYLPYS